MKQYALITKLVVGIILGLLVGAWLGQLAGMKWLMYIVVFGRSILKDLIQFFLPFIMISFLAVGIADLGLRAGKMLRFTVGLSYIYTVIACALGAAVIIAFFKLFPAITDIAMGEIKPRKLPPNIVNIKIPYPFSASLITSIVLGFVLGIGMTWTKAEGLMNVLRELRDISSTMIRRVIIPIIPFYIACVFAQLAYKGDIWPKMKVLGIMLIIIVILQWIWLFIQYTIAGSHVKENPFSVFKIVFPAYLTAWGTMSSAVTMPVSLARGKMIPFMKEDIADFVFPLCSQTHLSGSAMTITISAITVSMLTDQVIPGLLSLILFFLILSVIEVGAVGVPGGSIMAAWPVLVGVLGFGDEAMGLMFALFMIQDSFGTAANITGDATIAMIVNKKFGEAAAAG
ncbi:MAG: cation:dicarboxylase symporter family transporter [Deltaproteobacteria bacterium]|nr:MAG: cation:dicarboxylase symporter family transporter [Deltaproteobacteria bacterium]